MTALHVAGTLGAYFALCSTHCMYRWPVINIIAICRGMWWCQSDILLFMSCCQLWQLKKNTKLTHWGRLGSF